MQGVNLVKKHQKQTQSGSKTIPSGICEFEVFDPHFQCRELVEKGAEKASGKAAKTSKSTKTVAKKAPAKTAKAAKTETKPAAKKRATGKPAADKSGDGN